MSFPDDLDDVEVFTTGAVGDPGGRTFFLQARVTVKARPKDKQDPTK